MKTGGYLVVSLVFVFFTSCTFLSNNEEGVSVDCQEVDDDINWKYCITRTSRSTDSNILYFMHEGGGSERSWPSEKDLGRAIRDEWLEMSPESTPAVVSISFGQNWFLTTGKPTTNANGIAFGLKDFFINNVVPHIERKVLSQSPKSRYLLGLSMGAYNAGQLMFQQTYPFTSVALLCPALKIPRKKAGETTEELAERLGADINYTKRMLETVKGLPDNEVVLSENSILDMVKTSEPNSSKFYISCGEKDEFGFYSLAVELHEHLQNKHNINSRFKSMPGGHCNLDPKSLAEFILDD